MDVHSQELHNVDPEPLNDTVYDEASNEPNQQNPAAGRHVLWTQLRKLGATIYPTLSPFGRPTTFLGGSKFLIVGTFGAEILLFSYDQSLIAQLSPAQLDPSHDRSMLGPVTSLALSMDETHIIAGFGLGAVCVFDLEAPPSAAPKLLTLIRPMQPLSHNSSSGVMDRNTGVNNGHRSRFATKESHVHGVPVVACGFLGRSRHNFVSIDAAGVVVVHKYHRVLVEHVTRSRRLLGSYEKTTPIQSVAILDTFVALLTPNLLEVVSIDAGGTNPQATEVFRVPRARDTDELTHGNGVVKLREAGPQNIQLVYTWGHQLKLVDLDSRINTESSSAIATAKVSAAANVSSASVVRSYTHTSVIEQIEWMTADLMLLWSTQPKNELTLIKLSDVSVVDTDILPPSTRFIKLAVIGSTIFALGKYEFSIGQLANWADRLLWLVNSGVPANAIELALQFYNDEGDLSVFGLPASVAARRASIKQALPSFILTAVRFSAQYDAETLKTLLPETIHAVVVTQVDLLDAIFEIVDPEQWSRNLFLHSLTPYILQRRLTVVPPQVFKELILTEMNPQLFYMVNYSTLDLDFAFKLCSKHPDQLSKVKIYLENQSLHDYTSALHDNNKKYVFEYLTMILSSRIYPTGQEMHDSVRESDAKMQIYSALFLDDAQHTLLRDLLNSDKSKFYAALNEAFEDPWLNDNTEVSRQTILGLLLHINSMPDYQLSLFIAGNYAKYRQFLVLPTMMLSDVVDTLCSETASSTNYNDELPQLALLSMLSVYKPHDMSSFINQLVRAHYTLVLEHILRQRHRLLELVELKFNLGDFSNFWSLLDEIFLENRGAATKFIVKHFRDLLEIDLQELSRLTVRYSVMEVYNLLKIPDQDRIDGRASKISEEHRGSGEELNATSNNYDSNAIQQRLEFLNIVFQEIANRGGKLPPMDVRILYIELLLNDSNDEKQALVDKDLGMHDTKSDKLMYTLRYIFSGPQDIELPLIVDTLIASGRIDALALLLCRKDRHSEAMIYVLNHISEVSKPETTYYVRIACDICVEVTKRKSDEGKKLWQRLLETLMEENLNSELRQAVNVMVDFNSIDLAGIATYLLNTSTYKPAPQLVGQLYRDMSRRERALRCFYEIALSDGYNDLLEVVKARAEGWMVPVDGECETCGHKIVGLGIDAEKVYNSWFDAAKNPHRAREKHIDSEALVLFQCGHFYHYSCLQRMSNKRRCLICDS